MARLKHLTIQLNRDGHSGLRRIVRYVFVGLGSVLSKLDRCCQGAAHNVVGNCALVHRSKHPLHLRVSRNAVWSKYAHAQHDVRICRQNNQHGARNVRYDRLHPRNVSHKQGRGCLDDRRNGFRSCAG